MKISLQAVGVRFGALEALSEVSLDLEPGEIVGVVGPSGAGKSTLLDLLGAARRPDEGRLEVDGLGTFDRTARELRALRSRIGRVHQDLALVPGYRVVQNVLTGRLGRHGLVGGLRRVWLPGRGARAEGHALLEAVGIGDKIFVPTEHLSGGEQQRVAVARALYQEPTLLLADEPVSSVDPERARHVLSLLSRLCRARGIGLVVSLHDLPLAREMLPRLVGLRGGRVVFDGPSADLGDAVFSELYALEPGRSAAATP